MHAVRRTLAMAGLSGFLLLVPVGTAWADPTPTPDPSATASPTATPAATPSATPTASPTDAPSPTDEPTSGCEQNPEICQSGGAPGTTTDCGLPPNEGIAIGEPAPGTNPDGSTGVVEPGSPKPDAGVQAMADDDPVVCIASGVNPGVAPQAPGEGAILDKDATGQLPRTGPAPLLPTAAVGMWLVLLGVLTGLAGRRRTAHA